MNFDVIIRNAIVVDGTNSPWFKADVGIYVYDMRLEKRK